MKKALTFGLCLLLLVACDFRAEAEVIVDTGASASGDDFLTEERDVSGFDRVRLETLGELTVRQGDEARVVLTFSPKYEGAITTEVRGDTLVIADNRNTMTKINRDVLRYDVTLPQLEAVALDGSGSVNVGAFDADALTFNLDGSGNMTAEELEVGRLELYLDGSGSISTTGRADALTVDVAGSGKVDAGELRADEVNVSLAGSGDVSVCASTGLEASVEGSGDVTYYGEPASPDISVQGSGDVTVGGVCP